MSEIKALGELEGLVQDINEREINDHIIIERYSDGSTETAIGRDWVCAWREAALRQLHAIEREIAERYMEPPLDVDGVPIKVGDECWDRDTAERFEVSSVEWNGICWSAWSTPETRHLANKVLHHRPRTLEVVLEDMLIEKDETDLCSMGLIAKYAAEIREILGVSE